MDMALQRQPRERLFIDHLPDGRSEHLCHSVDDQFRASMDLSS